MLINIVFYVSTMILKNDGILKCLYLLLTVVISVAVTSKTIYLTVNFQNNSE